MAKGYWIAHVDVTAEQATAMAIYAERDAQARAAGVAVVPAMAFYGGLGDLLATAAAGSWTEVDAIDLAVGLDSVGAEAKALDDVKDVVDAGIARLRDPTLVADGTKDVLAPEANARTLAATIPGARLVLYPGAGHAFLFQDGTAFVTRVEAFLAGR